MAGAAGSASAKMAARRETNEISEIPSLGRMRQCWPARASRFSSSWLKNSFSPVKSETTPTTAMGTYAGQAWCAAKKPAAAVRLLQVASASDWPAASETASELSSETIQRPPYAALSATAIR